MTPTDAVLALLANGHTEASIAKAVETTQPTINRIRRGASQPNYALGKALVDLAEALPPVDEQAA